MPLSITIYTQTIYKEGTNRMNLFHSQREYDYFHCFIEVSKIAKEEAVFLEKFISAFQIGEVELQLNKMHELENKADMKQLRSLDLLPPAVLLLNNSY